MQHPRAAGSPDLKSDLLTTITNVRHQDNAENLRARECLQTEMEIEMANRENNWNKTPALPTIVVELLFLFHEIWPRTKNIAPPLTTSGD